MKSARIVTLSVWLGAILFFAVAVAPNVFAVLGGMPLGRALAGDIVQRALLALHMLGFICGVIFLLLGLRRLASVPQVVVLIMVLLTCASQFVITPKMHALRESANHFATPLSGDDLARFNKLHRLSTSTEGAIFLIGVVALIAESLRRDTDQRRVSI